MEVLIARVEQIAAKTDLGAGASAAAVSTSTSTSSKNRDTVAPVPAPALAVGTSPASPKSPKSLEAAKKAAQKKAAQKKRAREKATQQVAKAAPSTAAEAGPSEEELKAVFESIGAGNGEQFMNMMTKIEEQFQASGINPDELGDDPAAFGKVMEVRLSAPS
eukprot:SAG31_NODE_3998_length_3677_cov_10.286193_1_plen_162_part_00